MSKVKKDKVVDEAIKICWCVSSSPSVSINKSVVVKALDTVYSQYGQLSYGFTVSLDGEDYNFRTNTQGYLELNGSGIFSNNFILDMII